VTDFTIKNLKRDVEDAAPMFGLLVVGAPFEGANDAELIPGWWAD
jgi:hypothetical protein